VILSIGNANLDYFFVVDRMPKGDEEVEALDFYVEPGGSASNFAVAVAKLGEKAGILCCVGDDNAGEFLIRSFERENVDTSLIRVLEGVNTGRVFVILAKGEKYMIAFRGANRYLSADIITEEKLSSVTHVHVSGGRIEVAEKAFRVAKEAVNAATSYDPGSVNAKKGLSYLERVISLTDILFLNTHELKYLLKGNDLGKLFSINPEIIIVIKKGSKGSEVMTSTGSESAAAFKVQVVDVTGAGDAFDAGFLVGYRRNLRLKECLIFANAVAGIKVTRRGARSSPTLSEVVEFLREKGLSHLAEKVRT